MDKKHPCPSDLATEKASRPTDLSDPVQADLFDRHTALNPTSDDPHGGNQISSRTNSRPMASGQLAALKNQFSQLEKEADDARFLLVARDRELDRKKHQLEMMKSFIDEKRGELLAVRQVILESSGLEVPFDLDYPPWLKELQEDDATPSRTRRSQP